MRYEYVAVLSFGHDEGCDSPIISPFLEKSKKNLNHSAVRRNFECQPFRVRQNFPVLHLCETEFPSKIGKRDKRS